MALLKERTTAVFLMRGSVSSGSSRTVLVTRSQTQARRALPVEIEGRFKLRLRSVQRGRRQRWAEVEVDERKMASQRKFGKGKRVERL
jgi:hypothetical protein